jgi:regulator of sigma E protease
MEILTTLISKFASGIGPFVLLLGLLIFVHELGHYLVAVWCGVRVETFSLGFGKKIFSFKRGHTTYCISLIPLGGYVKMFGDDPTKEVSAEEKEYSFLHKPVSKRIAVVLAGPLMNLFFAAFLFSYIGVLGEEVVSNKIGDVYVNTAAYTAGFRSGDRITSVNGVATTHWKQIQSAIESSSGQNVTFQVSREDNTIAEVNATPVLSKNDFIFTTQREVGKIEGLGIESSATMVGVTSSDSIAAKAGIQTFDYIEKIDGQEIKYFRDIQRVLSASIDKPNWKVTVSSYSENTGAEQKEAPQREVVLENPYSAKPSDSHSIENIVLSLGITKPDLFLLNIKPDAPAAKAGMKKGDYIASIDNKPIVTWTDVTNKIKSYSSEQGPIQFGIIRGTETLNISAIPEKIELPTAQGAIETRYAIGIVPAISIAPNEPFLLKTSGISDTLFLGVEKSWEWSKFIAISFVRLVQAEVSPKNIGGVITIGRVASQSFEAGAVVFLRFMAILSINLFLLNLLPVPVLDGGHLVFFTIEAIKGSPLSLKKMEIAQQFGMILLLCLMVFAFYNDIRQLITSW